MNYNDSEYLNNCPKATCKNCGKFIYQSTENHRWYHLKTRSWSCYPFINAEPIPSEWHDDWF
jgi:hypothetical protein